jgi:hypothetical protein
MTYMTVVTKYQISAINWEKCDEKYLGRTEGQTDRGKTVYPPPPSRSGGIIICTVCRLCWFLYTLNIHCICSFFIAIFSATIDGRNLIFGHKLHIGTPSTIWGTYMKLVIKYKISAINSCWGKCDEKCAYMFNVYKNQLNQQTGSRMMGPKTLPTIWYTYNMLIFRRIFLSNYWWQKYDIWSQASYRYPISWEAFFWPIRFLLPVCRLDFYTHWTYMLILYVQCV